MRKYINKRIIKASQDANIIGTIFYLIETPPNVNVASLHFTPAYTLFPDTDSVKSVYERVKV